jgi:hypothetical protein
MSNLDGEKAVIGMDLNTIKQVKKSNWEASKEVRKAH